METQDVYLVGGPLDKSLVDAVEGPLLEVAADGLIHRYIMTTTRHSAEGREVPVYQFDGTVSPDGGMPGAEDPQKRLASPLADEMRES
jgi:hypothetical protein